MHARGLFRLIEKETALAWRGGGRKMTENGEKENEPHHRDLQRSPGSGTIRSESKVRQSASPVPTQSVRYGRAVARARAPD